MVVGGGTEIGGRVPVTPMLPPGLSACAADARPKNVAVNEKQTTAMRSKRFMADSS
jgi:hypothetical protein